MNITTRILNVTVPSQNTVANKTTPTTIGDYYYTPQNQNTGVDAGHWFNFKSFGLISTAATPGTLAVDIMNGGTVLGTFTFATLPALLSASAFMIDADMVITATGNSGAYKTSGRMAINNAGVETVAYIVNNSVTINTLNPNSITFRVTWGTANASNSIQFTYPRLIEGS